MPSAASSAGGLELLWVWLAGCGVHTLLWSWLAAGAHTGMSGLRILHLALSWPQEPGAEVTAELGLSVTLPDEFSSRLKAPSPQTRDVLLLLVLSV